MAQEAKDWSVDTSLLYYGEDNGRVEDVSLMASIRRAFDEDHSLNFSLTVDSLTGATPNGAVPANAPQTFTGPSGGGSYIVAPGEQPLDTTFLDTRIALAASWQQSLGNAMRWSVGLQRLGRVRLPAPRPRRAPRARLQHAQHDRLRRRRLRPGRDQAGRRHARSASRRWPGRSRTRTATTAARPAAATPDDSKDVADLLIGVTQVLSRRSLLEVAYSYGQSDGYLTDPYKILSVVDPVTGVPVGGTRGRGAVPVPLRDSARTRAPSRACSPSGAMRSTATRSRSTSAYMDDDWGVASQTAEARYRWNINDRSYLEPHLRWYTQSAADFYRTVLFAGDALPEFATADYRLADLDAYTIGAKYGLRTDHGEFSVRLEYYQQSPTESPGSAVGDLAGFDLTPDMKAVIVQFGYQFDF